MSNLPTKPELSRAANAWPAGDERRSSGAGRTSPDRYSYQRGDRDWDRDGRDREGWSRSHYVPSGQRSPYSSRYADTYVSSSRDTYHGRDYRGYDDTRVRDDRRRDWDRDRDWDRGRDRDRDRGYYKRDEVWTSRDDYSPDRPGVSRRGYDSRNFDWPERDNYRRERDRERPRSWNRDERPRDREHDRRHASPVYRPAPISPRRDYRHESRSPPRRTQPTYSSRGRRSTSPRSVGNRSRRSSPMSRARPELADTHPPHDIPRPPKSPSPSRASPSPKQYPRSAPSPSWSDPERHAVSTADRQLHQPRREEASPIKVEDQPVEDDLVTDGRMDVEATTEAVIREKDRSGSQEGQPHVKADPSSPTERQQQSIPSPETVAAEPSKEVAVTQPYLPIIPRYDAKPKFSAAYENEYNRLEAHRSHTAAECRRCSKASRRAFHELEMATLELRAAQHRRELAESHRKKAHHGQLGIDAEIAVNK